jgi:hypothetical protein
MDASPAGRDKVGDARPTDGVVGPTEGGGGEAVETVHRIRRGNPIVGAVGGA